MNAAIASSSSQTSPLPSGYILRPWHGQEDFLLTGSCRTERVKGSIFLGERFEAIAQGSKS